MRRARAFTLVELLVVVGIIGVLMGILLPAATRIRQQTKTLACAARIRDVGLTVKIYQDQNKRQFPSQVGAWVEQNTDPDSWIYKLRRYMKDTHAYACTAAYNGAGDDVHDGETTYLYNGFLAGVAIPPWERPVLVSRIQRPAETVVVLDHAIIDTMTWCAGAIEDVSPWWYPHPGQRRTISFADGHVEVVQKGDLQPWQLDFRLQ